MISIIVEETEKKKAENHKIFGSVFNHQTFYPESLL